jgi:hypothetical protein
MLEIVIPLPFKMCMVRRWTVGFTAPSTEKQTNLSPPTMTGGQKYDVEVIEILRPYRVLDD